MKKRFSLILSNLLLLLWVGAQAVFAESGKVIPIQLTLSDTAAGYINVKIGHTYVYTKEHGYSHDTLPGVFECNTAKDSTIYVDVYLNNDYRFLKWSDGETGMNRYLYVEDFDTTLSEVNLTAIVEQIPPAPVYHIVVESSDPTMGTVSGGGDYEEGEYISKSAKPKSGYAFVSWKSMNGYSVDKAQGNDTLVALFREVRYTASIYTLLSEVEHYRGHEIEDTLATNLDTVLFVNIRNNRVIYSMGDTMSLLVGDTLMATALPFEGHSFVKWGDGSTENPKMYICKASSYDATVCAYAQFRTEVYDSENVRNVVKVKLASSDEKMGRVYANVSHHRYGWISDTFESDFDFMLGKDTDLVAHAIPSDGYEFSHWSDGDTSATKRCPEVNYLPLGDSLDLTAYFKAKAMYNITVLSADPTMGKVSGGGTLPVGSTITKEAIPNKGYKLKEWKSLNGHSLTKVEDHDTLVAYFEPVVCSLSVSAFLYTEYVENGYMRYDSTGYDLKDMVYILNYRTGERDTLNGSAYYKVNMGDTVMFTAEPAKNHEFRRWHANGYEMSNPYVYVCDGESYFSIYACFYDTTSTIVTPVVDSVYVKVLAADDSLGYVRGGGYYPKGDTVTLSAEAYENAVFERWSDGKTSRVRKVVCMDTMTFVAFFKKVGGWSENLADEPMDVDTVKHIVSMVIDLSSLSLDEEQMKHVAFSASADVVKDSDSEVRVECYADSSCTKLLGTFTLKPEDTQETRNSIRAYKPTANVSESSMIPAGTKYLKVVMKDADAATAKELKSAFQNLEVTVARKSYWLTLSADQNKGTALGSGEFLGGDVVSIKAVPAKGYKFIGWSDGELEAERGVLVSQDMEIKALFDKTTGVEDECVDSPDDIVNVVTIQGYVLKRHVRRADALNGLPAGLYIVGRQKVFWME